MGQYFKVKLAQFYYSVLIKNSKHVTNGKYTFRPSILSLTSVKISMHVICFKWYKSGFDTCEKYHRKPCNSVSK